MPTDISSIKDLEGVAHAIKDATAREGLAGKLSIAQGSGNVGKIPKVNSSGNLELADEISELPNVTSSDNGKFLTVANGVWAATTVPNASGVSF